MGNFTGYSEDNEEETTLKQVESHGKSSVKTRTRTRRVFEMYKDYSNVHQLDYSVMPTLVLNMIFLNLPTDDLYSIFQTCKLFYIVANTEYFWKCYFENCSGLEVINPEKLNCKKMVFKCITEEYTIKNEIFRKRLRKSPSKNDKYDPNLKVLLLGDINCGKTSLCCSFFHKNEGKASRPIGYYERELKPPMSRKRVKIGDYRGVFVFQVRDVTGTFKSPFSGARGVILCFSLNDNSSFLNIERKWMRHVQRHRKRDISIIICGMKCDLERRVSFRDIRSLMTRLNLKMNDYCECSTMEKKFIHYPFGRIIEKVLLRESFDFEFFNQMI